MQRLNYYLQILKDKKETFPISRKLQAIQKGHIFHIWINRNVKKKYVWNEDNYGINKLLARLVAIDLFVRVSDSNGVQSINADSSKRYLW